MDFEVSSKRERRGILAGMLLGGARRNGDNFYLLHPARHRAHAELQRQLLERIGGRPIALKTYLTRQGERWLRLQPKQTPLIRVLVQRLYPGGTRTITRPFLRHLTRQGLVLWYLDRGSRAFRYRNGRIRSLEVSLHVGASRAECETIAAYFARTWGWQWGIARGKRGYRLRLGSQAGRQFLAELRPHLPPSLRHKADPARNATVAT